MGFKCYQLSEGDRESHLEAFEGSGCEMVMAHCSPGIGVRGEGAVLGCRRGPAQERVASASVDLTFDSLVPDWEGAELLHRGPAPPHPHFVEGKYAVFGG